MTNKQVLMAFLNGGYKGKSLNMTSTGEKLYSYNTVVAQRTTHGIIFNATKYSSTTSKQTSYFWKNIECFNLVKNVPINSNDLFQYL